MRFLTTCLIFTLLIGVLTACGRSRNDSSTSLTTEIGASGAALTYPQGQTLTILAQFGLADILERAGNRLRAAKASEGVNIQIDIEVFTSDEQAALLPSQLAAGLGPDIIVPSGSGLHLDVLIQNGLLADINPLIDNCPNTNRNDFFTNVLEAYEINSKLYTFPLRFTFHHIGINASLPEEFINRFTALDTVTYLQLLDIYMDLQRNYPEWNHLYLGANMNFIEHIFLQQVCQNINMLTGSVDVDNISLLSFVEDFRHGFFPWYLLSDTIFNYSLPMQSAENFELDSHNFAFYLTHGGLEQVNTFFNFENHYFVNFIPLVDDADRLLLNQSIFDTSDVFIINHAANGQLAWSFINELSTQPLYHIGDHLPRSFSVPIRRGLFEGNMDTALRQAISFSPSELWHSTWGGDINYNPETPHTLLPIIGAGDYIIEEQQIEAAMARLYYYANMPISPISLSSFYMPIDVSRGIRLYMRDESIPVSDIPEKIERSIADWLNSEIAPIIPYIPAETALAGREQLPIRTLSVLSVEHFAPVFLEAGNRMAEEWARREYDYNFELAFTSANFADYLPADPTLWTAETMTDAWQQMLARVGVALMAGQGHDIMCLSILTNLWSHVETGLFTDIYQLIDQCPYTNRAGFFTQALAPFEMDGSLYAFPTNFGFAYVGVNEILPQSFIDRFTALDTITLPELMSIYLELQQYPEFADIAFTNADLAASPYSAFHHVLLQYIDFPNSSANLTDSGFVAFLRDFRQLYNWANHPFDRFPHMSEYAHGQDFAPGRGAMERRVIPFYHIQNVSEQYAFWIEDVYAPALTMADSADAPFLHFIPIADYQGSLTYVTSTPTLAVTAIADGDLAWEFIQHLIYVTVNPTRQAQYNDGWHAPWGRYTLNTPISRAYFETHFTENLARIFDDTHLGEAPYAPEQVGRALARVANYNEMPMAYRNMPIPRSLYWDILEQFIRGLITPEDAAQQLHNRVSLWLIE